MIPMTVVLIELLLSLKELLHYSHQYPLRFYPNRLPLNA